MLQTVIDGQSAIREEMRGGFDKVNKKIDKVEKKLTKRLDTMGSQLAALEDDAPTIKEFDDLKKRVDKYHPETRPL